MNKLKHIIALALVFAMLCGSTLVSHAACAHPGAGPGACKTCGYFGVVCRTCNSTLRCGCSPICACPIAK